MPVVAVMTCLQTPLAPSTNKIENFDFFVVQTCDVTRSSLEVRSAQRHHVSMYVFSTHLGINFLRCVLLPVQLCMAGIGLTLDVLGDGLWHKDRLIANTKQKQREGGSESEKLEKRKTQRQHRDTGC